NSKHGREFRLGPLVRRPAWSKERPHRPQPRKELLRPPLLCVSSHILTCEIEPAYILSATEQRAPARMGQYADGGDMTGSDAPVILDDEREAMPLAQELAAAYKRMALFYRDQYGLTGPEADARARGADDSEAEAAAHLERTRNAPPDQVSWFGLNM